MNLEEFLDADPFEPAPTPEPKKRGRPAGQPKPKAKFTKPRWRVMQYRSDDLISHLRDVAVVLEPQTAGNVAAQLRVAAELLEMIQTKTVKD